MQDKYIDRQIIIYCPVLVGLGVKDGKPEEMSVLQGNAPPEKAGPKMQKATQNRNMEGVMMAKSKNKRSRGKKFSVWKTVKGLAYMGAIAAPVYGNYQYYKSQGRPTNEAAVGAIATLAGYSLDSKTFNPVVLMSVYTPVGVLGVVDFATTKVPIQQKISRGINSLIG